MLIRFSEVGHDKKSWEAEIPMIDGALDGAAMLKSIRKSGALMSREVECTEDGLIVVGTFGRPVGKWAMPVERN